MFLGIYVYDAVQDRGKRGEIAREEPINGGI